VPVVTALTLVSKVADNVFYEERILAIREAVSRGESLFRGFIAAGVFSPVEVQMVSIGEQTGDVEGMVNNLAVLYQEEVEFDASKMAETIEPIMLLFMAGLIMILLLGIFLPMWNMAQMAT
jgi:MSHA biogenesis protein MshG